LDHDLTQEVLCKYLDLMIKFFSQIYRRVTYHYADFSGQLRSLLLSTLSYQLSLDHTAPVAM
jgi:hypothetical protein